MVSSLPFRYLAVDGAIGVGKTTLVHLLCQRFGGEALLEDAENPFLDAFYRDTPGNALQTELYFMLTRFRQLSRVLRQPAPGRLAISDYAFQRNHIFAHLTLAGDELELFERLYRQLEPQIPAPDLVLYLVADTATCLERIHRRRRGYEGALSRDYLLEVVTAYNRYYRHYDRSPLLVIDAQHLDFPASSETLELLVERLLEPVDGAASLCAASLGRRLAGAPLFLGAGSTPDRRWQGYEQTKGDEDVGH